MTDVRTPTEEDRDPPRCSIQIAGKLSDTGIFATAGEYRFRQWFAERDVPVSALYPAILRPHRKLGYELAGTFTRHRLPLDAIPPGSSGEGVEELDPQRELEGPKACFHRSARGLLRYFRGFGMRRLLDVEAALGRRGYQPVDAGASRPIPIGVLSSMFTGYLRAPDAARLGSLDADYPAVPALASSFDGPDPWCPFFF